MTRTRSPDKFTWGKPCRTNNHQTADGVNLRYATGGKCIMCHIVGERFIGKTQEEVFEILSSPWVPKRSEEEVKKLRSAASARWNAKNKDKTKGYAEKYYKSEKRKEERREWYASLSKEEKAHRYQLKKAKLIKQREEQDGSIT